MDMYEYIPSEAAVVVVGGGGVTGCGGRSQEPVGCGTVRPTARPAARNSGHGSPQQRLL